MSELGLNSKTFSVWDKHDNQLQDADINAFMQHWYLRFVSSISNIDTRAYMVSETSMINNY